MLVNIVLNNPIKSKNALFISPKIQSSAVLQMIAIGIVMSHTSTQSIDKNLEASRAITSNTTYFTADTFYTGDMNREIKPSKEFTTTIKLQVRLRHEQTSNTPGGHKRN